MFSASSAYSQPDCYKPSGAVPILGAAAALIISVTAGAILGAVYAFANHHDPLIYLNLALAVGLGWVLGWLVSWDVRTFRIRNTAAATVIALAAFASAYLTHWPVYIATVLADYEFIEGIAPYDVEAIAELSVDLAKEPEDLWELICGFNEEGVWSITGGSSRSSGLEVKGIFLTLIWIAEALVICCLAAAKPRAAAGRPYSERQEKWLEPRTLAKHIAFVEKENEEEFFNAISRGNYSALSTPLPDGEPEQKYAAVVLYNDAFEPYVTVTNVSQTGGDVKKPREGIGKKLFRWFIWDSSTKEDAVTSDVIKYLKVSPTAAQNIASALY